MKRTGMPRRKPDPTHKSRKPIKPQSAKRRAEQGPRRDVVADVLARDGYRCVPAQRGAPGDCMGGLSAHEVVKRSQRAGAHLDADNCVACCAGHNTWIEDNPAEAKRLGLTRSNWE